MAALLQKLGGLLGKKTSGFYRALVSEKRLLTRSVVGLTLQINDRTADFLPGQWLDLYVPGIADPAGLSMISSSEQLHRLGTVDLAVQFSEHPSVQWVHSEKCRVGKLVHVKFGGQMFFEPGFEPSTSLCLVAGGVGINPMMSILAQTAAEDTEKSGQPRQRRVSLLYSAKRVDDLLFVELLRRLKSGWSAFDYQLFLTEQHPSPSDAAVEQLLVDDGAAAVHRSRLTAAHLQQCMQRLPKPFKVFLCGPPDMIDSINADLQSLQVPKSAVLFEKWSTPT